LRQVLANLLSNAVKFTDRGEVLICVRRIAEKSRFATLRFTIVDTGVGIGGKGLPDIFAPFTQGDASTTRKYGGTGLGLSICKQLVDLMGGHIGCEPNKGAGSTFWFEVTLPRQPEPVAPVVEPRPPCRVLIAIDHETTRKVVRNQLAAAPFCEAVTTTAALAHETLQRGATEQAPFDVVILDTEDAPMDGLALAQAIKSDSPVGATKLLVVAPLGKRLTTVVMRQVGISACLVKPIRQSRLLDCLADLLINAAGADISQGASSLGEHIPLSVAGVRVLVAEDNIVNQRVVLSQLKRIGFTADAVSNGREALEALKRAPYDIILMDCQMPEIDGYEAAARIRAEGLRSFKSEPYLIALTANALPGDRERCLTAGMNDYILKPVRLDSLEGVLQRALLKVEPRLRNGALREEDQPGGASSASPITEPLDRDIIAGLRELDAPGDPVPADRRRASVLRDLADLFLRDARPKLMTMVTALDAKDLAALASIAHSLKGSASNLGARRLAEICATLEKSAKASEVDSAQNLLAQTRAEFQRVESALAIEMQK
jgi:CheY-like chemotaxis protein